MNVKAEQSNRWLEQSCEPVTANSVKVWSLSANDMPNVWPNQKEIGRFFALGVLFIYLFFSIFLSASFAQSDDNKAKSARSEAGAGNANRQDGVKNETFLSKLFHSASASEAAPESFWEHISIVSSSFLLAALLSAAVAFRPRKKFSTFQSNPYVAQTQILLSVIAAAMMMIVSDNAARAFGIFAAASLVRYRTNIRDPKETSVLLACLGIGLATGVRRWELALVLTVFILLVLLILEKYEPTQVFRTMELKVKSRDVENTDVVLKRLFKKRHIEAELRKLDLADEENHFGTILYFISVNPTVSTDLLTEQLFSADPDNIDTIEWEQKKSNPYIYR
jgi:uncharacterized membrane protein YhiD involved in acid resistance